MKADVRKQVLLKRNTLSKEEINMHTQTVCAQLLPYLKGTVGIYHAYGSELNVDPLLRLSNLQFAIPKTTSDYTLHFYTIDKDLVYQIGSYDIREPKSGNRVNKLDVVIIPLVAFDEHCNRLGHGAGYYDRFLEHFQGLKIGVAHDCQRVENVYEEEFDIPLDIIITEERTYKK